jgi:hypothetical protein
MVQKGKFSARAAAFCAKALNNVDLPTFGSPNIPTRIFMLMVLCEDTGTSAV